MRCLPLLIALAGTLIQAVPSPLLGASPDPCGADARDAVQVAQQGLLYYREAGAIADPVQQARHYERALRCYNIALPIADNPAPLYHPLGLVYEKLERFAEAVHALERFLREVPESERKVGVTRQIDDKLRVLYQKVARLDIDTAPGQEVRVDQRIIGTAPLGRLIVVLPGTHSVTAGDPAHGTRGTQVLAVAGQVHRVDLATPLAPPVPLAGGPQVRVAPPGRPIYKRWWFWTIVGVAAAGITAGAVAGTKPWEPKNTGPIYDIGP